MRRLRLLLKVGIFLLFLFIFQSINGSRVFAQQLPDLEYCEPGTLIECDEFPFYHGSYCCRDGGCPELGDDDPGPWGAYSWWEWRCKAPVGYNYCITYIVKEAYECYAGDVCKAGSSSSDSFLEAGKCDPSGDTVNCWTGGAYKQCCSGSYPYGAPTSEICGGDIPNRGGDKYGWCNVGSGSACDTSGGGGFIACSGYGGSYDDAYGDCQAGEPPPTPGPGTPTPTPTPGGGCTPKTCPPGTAHNNWCENPDDCRSQGGIPIDDIQADCNYFCKESGDDLCCTEEGPPGEGRIRVNIDGVDLKVCDLVTIEVYQEPDNSGDSACYYREIEVKLNNPGGTLLPPNFIVCKAGNFQDRHASNECDWGGDDGRCRTCIWDTNNIQTAADGRAKNFPVRQYPTEPSERYEASVSYGGHGEDPCTDGQDSHTDRAWLKGESIIYFDPEDGCPAGTTKEEVDISSQVDPHFNSMFGWTKRAGEPGVLGWSSNCCYRSRGSRCDPWGHCGDICPNPLDESLMEDACRGVPSYGNFLCDRAYEDHCMPREYTVSTKISIPPETVGDEYLVSVMGTGIKAERTGHGGGDDGESRPFMKLASGDRDVSKWGLSTVFYQFSKECSWREGTYKMLAWEPWIEVYLRSKTKNKTHGTPPPQAAFDNLKLYHCKPSVPAVNPKLYHCAGPPPTCTVSGLTTVNVNTPATYCVDATNAPQKAQIYKSPTANQDWTNVYDSNVDGCGETSFTQVGTYYVVCNAYASDETKCSGNPWCPCAGWSDCTTEDVLTVTVTAPDPWFQTKGGDVHGEEGVSSPIPSGCKDDPDCEPYLNLALDGVNGVVSSGDSIDISPGGEQVGEINDWWVQGESVDLSGYGYDYFDSLIDQDDGDPVLSDGKPTSGIYKISGDQTISNTWNVADDETFVILISSNLTIDHNIKVTEGGFLAFIVNGDIEIGEIVNKAQGIYIANGSIITSGESDNQLKAEGMFIGLTGVSLNREFKDEGLNTQPVELFTHRPDLFINAPDELKKPRFTWQEVAP